MIQIVVPMGGEGKRFVDHGYAFPKPLIEIAGKPMVEIIVENLTPSEPHQFIFVCNQAHLQQFALRDVLDLVAPGNKVVRLQGVTAGALCSVLLGVEHLQHDGELLIANADQYVTESVDNFLADARSRDVDGHVMTFPSTHPKWSYVKVEGDEVVAVAEKQPISRSATAGLYYFRRAADFVSGAEQMLLKSATVAGEFYIAPVYNQLILRGKKVGFAAIPRDSMHGLGTPEEVEMFASTVAKTLAR